MLHRRWSTVALVTVLAVAAAAALAASARWWAAAVPLLACAVTGAYDVVQRRHSVLRNYPVLGHLRFTLERLRPELQQYFIERDFDGRPFDRETRSTVYERAKGVEDTDPFGTERSVYQPGYEFFLHTVAPRPVPEEPYRVHVGGPRCTRPYRMALLNVSAMSFGSLSGNAIRALNRGAAEGGFAHDTGEGGISDHHLCHGGDLIWEIGTGYFGCRTPEGGFDEAEFARKAAWEQVRAVSLKLSQGAKPGVGGVLPGGKVSAEIARVREVPQGRTVVSPPYHRVFGTPREMVRFLERMRVLAGGKPVGFKLCVGYRREFLSLCKAMLEEDITPDFIVVDGAEGGTGAAPLEFVDHVGVPLTEGLNTVHNALTGIGLRERVAVGASGKVATGSDLVKRLVQGADYTNAARAMMFAVGCIQSQRCHANTCPVGVATQDPRRERALDVADKYVRVRRFQEATVRSALEIMGALGVDEPAQLRPRMLYRRTAPHAVASYAELYDWLAPGVLLGGAARELPGGWERDWDEADPDRFTG
ncbi:FMN-binding glutamate synthase family protein [Streptomyces sp. HNM0574]|uniref:FMN-binding glutamate synthase family protein n=1 Tax=Streptomyces sp. HNM0574 TaxID=2714954 RepID=UPI00146E4A15|nr:FMN-binding glutamate synthase family protein [Streptomyces sp. HNM0574]NLU68127.1 FMN-binding glutamate synthase family protein [Streptomyces sp. HNM0574]